MTLPTADVDFLRGLVAERSGNVIAARQVYLLEERLAPMAQEMGLSDVQELVGKVRSSKSERLSTQIAEAVTVNETSFFRDMHVFDALGKDIMQDVIKRNEAKKSIRIWCAASSSGQEPYSIAMTIRERFPHLSAWNIKIVATDLCEEMLRRTREGEYTQLEANRGLPIKKLVRFFDRNGTIWRAKDELRSMIEPRRLNLTKPWPFLGDFDVVMIRNVLIYFDRPTKTDILKRIQRVLRPEGYLFIGAAETVIGLGVPYKRQEINGTVCYRPSNS